MSSRYKLAEMLMVLESLSSKHSITELDLLDCMLLALVINQTALGHIQEGRSEVQM